MSRDLNTRRELEPYFLKTKRLGFRTWKPADRALAMGLWGNFEVTRLFDGRGPLSQEQVLARLNDELVMQQTHGIQYWPIFQLEDGDHIGACGLRPYGDDAMIRELGFHICAAHWGKGFATEAARAVIDYAFNELNLNALFAGHNPNNAASRHLLEKLGFVYTHDAFYPATGLDHPSYLLKRK